MAEHQALYRRYRSQRFDEVLGQEHVVRALRNAVRDDRVSHAYLFSGPRGTGKTSTARILAKALNCPNVTEGEPCGVCEVCRSIEHGTSFDVFELDAASNNGVDSIRELNERAALGTAGRRKVYILDEVHMLSKGASNALLKTLEDPPAHVVFVLATTDPQKVEKTISSRTQHLQFHLLPADVLAEHVEHIAKDAGLELPAGALDYVLRVGAGSARDTLSALDQVVAAGSIPDDGPSVEDLVDALADRDAARALAGVAAAVAAGTEVRGLTERLIAWLRDTFLVVMAPDVAELSEASRARAAEQGARLGAAATVRALEVLGAALVEMRHATDHARAARRRTGPHRESRARRQPGRVARTDRASRTIRAAGRCASVRGWCDSTAIDVRSADEPDDERAIERCTRCARKPRAQGAGRTEGRSTRRAARARRAGRDPARSRAHG